MNRENQNTHFMFNNFQCCRTGQATHIHMTIWRMLIACWIPEATDTLRICNTYCFSIAAMVSRTCLSVRLDYIVFFMFFCTV
jgi:hypothetical protein